MSIRVGKYDYKTKKEANTLGYINVLIHTTGELSPYTIKDKNGVIMENWWQFHKIWEKVDSIKQPISQYDSRPRWEHPSEVHMIDGIPTSAYWKWREKGFAHHRWVRYPNGFKNHGKTKGSMYDKNIMLDYIEARKRIYFTKYREIAIQTKQFKELKKMYNKGAKIQINEVDGPTFDVEYPYNLCENGSIEMSPRVLLDLINNPKQAFGHGYCLAACLMDVDLSTTGPLVIWTDGACTNNGYPNAKAGYGVHFEGLDWDISRRLKGVQTNNRAELYAVYAALKRLYWKCKPCQVHFRIDNQIALNTLMTDRKSGANWDIIEKLYKLKNILIKKGFTITGEWVKGHSKVAGNERADQLASFGAQKNIKGLLDSIK